MAATQQLACQICFYAHAPFWTAALASIFGLKEAHLAHLLLSEIALRLLGSESIMAMARLMSSCTTSATSFSRKVLDFDPHLLQLDNIHLLHGAATDRLGCTEVRWHDSHAFAQARDVCQP